MGVRTKIKKRKVASYARRVKGGNKRLIRKPAFLAHNPNFDSNATLKENYKNLGIALDPNEKTEFQSKQNTERKLELSNVESVDSETLKKLIQVNEEKGKKNVRNLVVNEEERLIIGKMQKKYVSDFYSMSQDRKLNTRLWTEKQIAKKIDFLEKIN